MSINQEKPSKKAVHFVFWGAHISLLAGILLRDENVPRGEFQIGFVFLILAIVAGISYFFVIGRYARKINRSALVWGGLSFLFSPIGIWVSYLASFIASPKEAK